MCGCPQSALSARRYLAHPLQAYAHSQQHLPDAPRVGQAGWRRFEVMEFLLILGALMLGATFGALIMAVFAASASPRYCEDCGRTISAPRRAESRESRHHLPVGMTR